MIVSYPGYNSELHVNGPKISIPGRGSKIWFPEWMDTTTRDFSRKKEVLVEIQACQYLYTPFK